MSQTYRDAEVVRRKALEPERLGVKTSAAMKASIAERLTLRRHLEEEIRKTCKTTADLEVQLDRTQKELKRHMSSPEKMLRGGNSESSHFQSINEKYAGALGKLRSKLKGASYVGQAGRQLDVVFARFDRDRSGELDEDEIKRAFRRTMKVPPSILSDADIHSLCSMLDLDKSGSVSIREIADFLESDVSALELESQCRAMKHTIKQLNAAKQQALGDLRSKTAAWQIDTACSKVNLKRLGADGLLPANHPQEVLLARTRCPPVAATEHRNSVGTPAPGRAGTPSGVDELFRRMNKGCGIHRIFHDAVKQHVSCMEL